jgi:hypothetical protein
VILVDPPLPYTKVKGYRGRRTEWCHMVSTVSEDELHAFADRLGLRRDWFQGRHNGASSAHYDLARSVRAQAVRLGAVEVTPKQLALFSYDGMRRRGLLQTSREQEAELVRLAHLLGPQPS